MNWQKWVLTIGTWLVMTALMVAFLKAADRADRRKDK
jgi:hypothetical protein